VDNQTLRTKLNELIATDANVATMVSAGNVSGVVNAINALGLTRMRSRLTTSRGIYAALGMANGAAVMHILNSIAAGQLPGGAGPIPAGHQLLAQVPVFADLVPWLRPPCEGLDFGSADLQGVITALQAGGLFTEAQANGLRALGKEPDTVSVSQVAEVLNEGVSSWQSTTQSNRVARRKPLPRHCRERSRPTS